MSNNNRISVEIPQNEIQKVTEMLQQCKKILAPYLQGLTEDERQNLFKMGDKTVTTVSKVKGYLKTNPEFAPAYMDTEEFLKDELVVAQLNPIFNLLTQLWSDTGDTVMLAGSDAITAAMLYYGTVNEANSKGVATAKPVYEDLKGRFAKRGRKPKSPNADK